jgi:hypothetical protein
MLPESGGSIATGKARHAKKVVVKGPGEASYNRIDEAPESSGGQLICGMKNSEGNASTLKTEKYPYQKGFYTVYTDKYT